MPFDRLFITILLSFILIRTTEAQVVAGIKRPGPNKIKNLDSNGWKRTGVLILNVNQSAQSDWSGGGENFQIGINLILNKAVHNKKGKYSFDSYIDLELGLVNATSFKQFRKITDRCDLTVEVEHSIGKKNHFNYGLLGNINTQLFAGYNYREDGHPKMSSFLSPGKIILSPGIDYKDTKADRYFSLFVSPSTIRWITKRDRDFYNAHKFGVDSFRRVYTEIGAYLSIHYSNKFSNTTNLISRLDLFSNYKRKPGNVDVLMNNILTLRIAKNFVGTLLFDLLYDHDVKRRIQIQEVMGLGLRLNL